MNHPVFVRRALGILAVSALLLPLLACGFTPEAEDPPPSTVPAVVEPTAPAEPAAAAGGACSRVAGCCRAYVAAMGGSVPASTCDAYSNVANMPESMCESTLSGYRSGLTAMSREVPTECAE